MLNFWKFFVLGDIANKLFTFSQNQVELPIDYFDYNDLLSITFGPWGQIFSQEYEISVLNKIPFFNSPLLF